MPDWLWAMMPFVALAIAIPMAVRYDRKAARKWEKYQRRLQLRVDIQKLLRTCEALWHLGVAVESTHQQVKAVNAAYRRSNHAASNAIDIRVYP